MPKVLGELRAAARHHARLLTICAGAVMTVGGFSVAGSEFTDTPLSSWIQALATSLALLAAIVAANYTAGVLQVEQKREKDRAEQVTAEQAGRVAAWYRVRVPPTVPRRENPAVYLRNASDLPVYSVIFRLFLADAPAGYDRISVLHPHTEPLIIELEQKHTELQDQSTMILGGEWHVGIEFRDARSNHWYRGPDGVLRPGRYQDQTEDSGGVKSVSGPTPR